MLDPKNKALALTGQETNSRAALSLAGAPSLVPAEPGSNLPPALSSGPTLATLLQALRRRWLLASTLPLLGALVTVAAILTLWPARYTAIARIQLAGRSEPGVFENHHDEDLLTFKTNIAAQLKSTVVIQAALKTDEIRKLGASGDLSVEAVEASLKTEFKGPGILEVRLAGDRPAEVAVMLNAI